MFLRKPPVSVSVFAIVGVLGLGASALSCSSSGTACGRGRYESVARRTGSNGTTPPYCVSLEAEGSGGMNLRVDPTRRRNARADGDGGTAPGEAPLVYAMTTPRFDQAFVDICGAPGARRVIPNADDATAQIPEADGPRIPFPVRMYDTDAPPPFTVSTNGWLSLQPGAAMGPTMGAIPSSVAPNLVAAPFWRDLVTRGGVCYAIVGNSPERRFVVQWDDAYEYGNANAHLVFQVVIHEMRGGRTHNVIDLIYQRMDGATPDGAGMGIENVDGTLGEPVQGQAVAPRAVRFTPSR